ncbi:hypothetical protein AUP68_11377 [Ilyonectria robusta]
MSQAVATADTQLAAFWDCAKRFVHEVYPIICNQYEYQKTYHAHRIYFDHELRQFAQRTMHPDSNQRDHDKLLELADKNRELEIQHTQSVKERLRAAYKGFVHAIIDGLGAVPFDLGVEI